MAQSTCPKCPGTAFEAVEATITRCSMPKTFIQCTRCGCVVGVIDSFNVPELINTLANGLKIDIGFGLGRLPRK